MTKVNKIFISGFRGICSKVEINLLKGKAAQSTIIYGANGTGKSSVTDAWEWLATSKIQHLAREGAEENAYPHMAAKIGATQVEVEFSDPAIGMVGLDFNNKRVTIPQFKGNLTAARLLIKQPCHIRYSDLTRFVFLRKADRYDALATLMGFVPQMEYQKSLRRVQSEFESVVQNKSNLLLLAENSFKQHFKLTTIDNTAALQLMATQCEAQGFDTAASEIEVRSSSEKLKSAVTNDKNLKLLVKLQTLEMALKASKAPPQIYEKLVKVRSAVAQLKAEQKEKLFAQLLVPLFKAAKDLLAKTQNDGICPLCKIKFHGDLKEHVKMELEGIQHINLLVEKLQAERLALSEALSMKEGLLDSFLEASLTVGPDLLTTYVSDFKNAAKSLDDCIKRVTQLLNFDSSSLTDKLVSDFKREESALSSSVTTFDAAKAVLLGKGAEKKISIEKNPERIKLLAAHQFVLAGLSKMDGVIVNKTNFERATKIHAGFTRVVDIYVKACLENVQKRFDEISDNVKLFFEILEKDTAGLGAPKMKLLTDQDRSVVLEVFFHGAPIHPAHKYLSESQLNSFGLAVFIASATHFNKDCQFLLLDDVVNSFDSYKRPRLIELIQTHLKEHQVVLLTHDRFWRDLLHRQMPSWNRIDFTKYTFGTGPVISPAKDSLELIEHYLDADEVDSAAGAFARYLEDVLQELCEAFEVELKYNRRNEYVLDTLIDRLKARAAEKLGSQCLLVLALDQLLKNNAYRNWCIHCKNPVSPVHANEIKAIVSQWKEVLSFVQCAKCSGFLRYDGKRTFKCRCGLSELQKADDKNTQHK